MSRRKQPAPSRLSDDLEGEGTGMGKKAKSESASEVTRRSSVKGRQAKDRKQQQQQPPLGSANGHSRERPTTRRHSSLTKEQGSKTAQRRHSRAERRSQEGRDSKAAIVNGKTRGEKRKREKGGGDGAEGGDEVRDTAVTESEPLTNGHVEEEEEEEEREVEEGEEEEGATNGRETAAADDDEQGRQHAGSAASPVAALVAESAGESAAASTRGGGTTAGADQVPSEKQALTGAGAASGGHRTTLVTELQDEIDDTKLADDAEAATEAEAEAEADSSLAAPLNSCDNSLPEQTPPTDFPSEPAENDEATAPHATAIMRTTLAVDSMEGGVEGSNGADGEDGVRGCEEMERSESAVPSDTGHSLEGDTKSQNGMDDGAEKRVPSPTSSFSNDTDSTPSKNSMKRRRPFECPESLTCQVCNIDFPTAHELTIHVRTHNAGSSLSCTMCGKTLSSTSSLDRHMLIHSGERPFTCPLCSMSFTTNGNMHRHLRTHEKGGELPPPDYVVKHDYAKPRKRVPSRRLIENMDSEGGSLKGEAKKKSHSEKKRLHSEKKALNLIKRERDVLSQEISDQPMDLSAGDLRPPQNVSSTNAVDDKKAEEELSCPICSKTFLCRYGLQTHIEQHPNKVLECMICNTVFRSQKALRMHVHMAHRKNNPLWPKESNGVTSGEKDYYSMTELSFTEFSSPKFPLIAQVWCEKNSPRGSSEDILFDCDECNKTFPCQSALNLHHEKSHSSMEEPEMDLCSDSIEAPVSNEEMVSRDEFLAALNLKPRSPPPSPQKSSPRKSPIKEDDKPVLDKKAAPILNSMLNKPSLASPEKAKTSLLQQHLQASPLLAMKHFSNPLGAPLHVAQKKSVPMRHSPVKGVTAGSVPTGQPEEAAMECEPSAKSDLEPRSGDVAMEMHTPSEFASQSNRTADTPEEEVEDDVEGEGNLVIALESVDEEPCDLSSANKKRGTHICKYCKKVFPFSSTLKVHTRSHMGLMPYKCMLCDYASADKSTLVRHMRTHSGERPYACKVCDFAFTTKANCERHVRKRHNKTTKEEAEEVILHNPAPKHDNESKYSSPCTFCKICNRDFKFFRDLQNHLRVHEKTPQKPFTCTKCQVGFSSLSNCARHILRRHEEVTADDVESFITVYQHEDDKNLPIIKVPCYVKEEPTSESPVLDDEGVQVEPLDFSVKKETDGCAPAKKRRTSIFTEDTPIDLSMPKSQVAANLTVKRTNLLGRTRFKEVYHKFYSETMDALVCPHCATAFQRGSHLKSHIRTHTAERPHRCHLCAAAFTMKANLEAHIMRRHNNADQSAAQQSFIPKSATPMQFKLMAKTSSNLRFTATARASKTAVPLISPNTPVGASQQIKLGPSPHNSVGSDSSGELASVSKMLAATDSNQFKIFLSPQESRSPITVSEIFQSSDDDDKDDGNHEIMANISGEPPEMRMEFEENGTDGEVSDYVDQAGSADNTMDLSVVKKEGDDTEHAMLDDELGGELQIVEDEKVNNEGEDAKPEEDDKKKKGTKFESKQCCPYCGRRFPWISSLRRHILTHTGLKPYQCPQCGANFSTKSNCERHIVRRHGGARPGSLGGSVPGGQDHPFMCPECKEFKCTTRTQLQNHYEQRHPHIDFTGLYPEAKKVASTGTGEILKKGTDVKVSSDTPLCLTVDSKAGVTNNGESSQDIPTDLSTSNSKSEKKAAHTKPLQIKMFVFKGIKKHVTSGGEVGVIKVEPVDAEAVVVKEGSAVEDEMKDSVGEDMSQQLPEEGEIEDSFDDFGEGVEDGPMDISQSTDGGPPLTLMQSSPAARVPGQAKPRSRSKKPRARFECTQCCKRFKTALTLEKHEKVHEVDHPYHCTDCKATFTTKFNCHRHMMKLHKRNKDDMAVWGLKDEGNGSTKNSLANGDDGRLTQNGAFLGDNELENMSTGSLNIGDSVSAIGDPSKRSLNGTPVSFSNGSKSRKRVSGSLLMKKVKSPKLDEALRLGAVLDLQGSSDKLMAVENWLNSDLEPQNGEMNGYGPDDEMSSYDAEIPILNPESPTSSSRVGDKDSEGNPGRRAPGNGSKKPGAQQQQGLYMASFLEDEDSLVAQDVANPTDVFSGGQGDEERNDIISNLLGIQDSSVVDQMLESADSAARLLEVTL